MDNDKKDNEGGGSGGLNTWMVIGGFIIIILLYLFVMHSMDSMDSPSNNFGFSLEDAFNIMK